MSDPFAPGLLARLPAPPRKVAVLRAARIGDFICATPALRALRAALPAAEIALITLPLLHDLALRLPYVDRSIAFPGFPGIAEQFFEARRCTQFFAAMQAEAFDLAIQMQGTGVYSNPFTLLLGARTTAGCVRPGDPAGRLDAALPMPAAGHEIERVLALTTFLGAPAQGTATVFPLWPEDHAAAAALLNSATPPLLGLHPGARDLERRWPPERFAAAGRALHARSGGTLLLLGDAEARPAAAQIARRIGVPCRDLTGRTSLVVLGAIIARLNLLLTNDSGPAHIAYALGTPTLALFSIGDPTRYGPPRPGPYRVLRPPAGGTDITQISVEAVVAAAATI